MTDQSYVYAGVGWWRGGTRGGVFRLAVGDGEVRQLTKGLPEETHVQAISLHPLNPEIVYIGTQDGPYRSTDHGERWERLGFPDRGMQVWSILVLCGGTAAAALLPQGQGITRLRGRWFDLEIPGLDQPVPTLPMFHPSFLLRTPERKREAWRDLLALRARLDELMRHDER